MTYLLATDDPVSKTIWKSSRQLLYKHFIKRFNAKCCWHCLLKIYIYDLTRWPSFFIPHDPVSNGLFQFLPLKTLTPTVRFMARSTANKQCRKQSHVFFYVNQVNQWPCIIPVEQLDSQSVNLHKPVNTGKVHFN